MKKILIAHLPGRLAAACPACAPSAQASGPPGVWKTIDDETEPGEVLDRHQRQVFWRGRSKLLDPGKTRREVREVQRRPQRTSR